MALPGGSESRSEGATLGRATSARSISGQMIDMRVEKYLSTVQKGLAGLRPKEAADIVEELRSHILDKAALQGEASSGAIDNVLEALGNPEELAAEYMADDLLERAASGFSPLLLFQGLLRWAGLSVAGVFVLFGCTVGYFVGFCLMLCAFLKPLHPHSAGLWRLAEQSNSYSLRLGFGAVPPGGKELLGWWMVPVGLLLGGGLCLLTTQIAFWCVQQFRRSRTLTPMNAFPNNGN